MNKSRWLRLSHLVVGTGMLWCVLAAHAGTVYKCPGKDGITVFSETPCSSTAQPVKTWEPKKDLVADSVWCADGEAARGDIDACVDLYRPILRDPRGAYADAGWFGKSSKTGERALFVDGHAKNGFGGTNAMQMHCALDATGAISPSGSQKFLDLEKAAVVLNVNLHPQVPVECH